MRRVALFLGCVIGAAACTAPPLRGQQGLHEPAQCFWATSVTGFSDAGPNSAILNIGFKESWQLALSPDCPDVNYAMKIGIVSGGSQRVCTGRPAELVVPSASGSSSQRCRVRSVRKLSPEEAAAARGAPPPR